MKPKVVLTIAAVLAVLFGLALTLLPSQMLEAFGLTPQADGIVLSRDLGVVLVAIGVLNWMARDVVEPTALRAILVGNLLVQALEAIVDTYHILSGQLGPEGWGGVVLHVVLAILFVLAFLHPRPIAPTLEGTPAKSR